MVNQFLKILRERRSHFRFKSTPINAEQINLILEAGRWAPSWANTQPWRFIIIKDEATKEKICRALATFTNISVKDAPICVAICVNPNVDQFHFIEDGAVATQNMALAAQSIGLGTCWIGVFSLYDEKKSAERKIKEILKVPDHWRLISILPLGVPKFEETQSRKELPDIVDSNSFSSKEKQHSEMETKKQESTEKKFLTPSSARELESALV
jgi:nitroreductase